MGEFSVFHWLIVLAIIVLLFGAGKLPHVMGDVAKGIKSFKAAMKADEEAPAKTEKPQIEAAASTPAPAGPARERVEAAPRDKVEPTA